MRVMPAAERAAPPARQRGVLSVVSQPGQLTLGVAVGVGSTALALGGHAISGGATPGPALLAALTLAAVLACVVLGRTRWKLPGLLGALVVMQAVFHLTFDGQAGVSMPAGHSHRHDHSPAAATPALAGLGWQMLAAHIVAVLVTTLVIRRGAQICRLLAAVLGRSFWIIRILPGLAPPPLSCRVGARAARRASMRPQLVLCAAPRRGPPALLAT